MNLHIRFGIWDLLFNKILNTAKEITCSGDAFLPAAAAAVASCGRLETSLQPRRDTSILHFGQSGIPDKPFPRCFVFRVKNDLGSVKEKGFKLLMILSVSGEAAPVGPPGRNNPWPQARPADKVVRRLTWRSKANQARTEDSIG
jgi:hypothetical protein